MGTSTGKTILALGSSRGIGAVIVRRFVTDRANVRFTYTRSRDTARRLAQEAKATAVFIDSADRGAVIDIVRKSGVLDILVVNAGTGVFGEALELNVDNTDRPFRTNTHTPYHASVEAVRQMLEDRCILIIGFVNGDRVLIAGAVAYAASKSILQGIARGLARDFGPRGITIDVVQSGLVDTDANPADGPIRDILHSLMAIKRYG